MVRFSMFGASLVDWYNSGPVVVLLRYFSQMVQFQFYEKMMLFQGIDMELKDKIMLHCFKEVTCQQDSSLTI